MKQAFPVLSFPGLFCAALALLATGFGCATTETDLYGPDSREFLLSLNGAYVFEKDDSERETVTTQGELGYFMNRTHEVGAFFGFLYSNNSLARRSSHTILIGPFYNYNIYIGPRTSYFFGPQVGLSSFDDGNSTETDFSYGVHVGLRHWLSPRVSFSIQPRYTHTDFDKDVGGEQDRFDILFGFGVRLGGPGE